MVGSKVRYLQMLLEKAPWSLQGNPLRASLRTGMHPGRKGACSQLAGNLGLGTSFLTSRHGLGQDGDFHSYLRQHKLMRSTNPVLFQTSMGNEHWLPTATDI